MKGPTLAACPFCGSRSVRVLAHEALYHRSWAQADCKTCGARGPREVLGGQAETKPWAEWRAVLVLRAVNGWNSRVSRASDSGTVEALAGP